MTQVSSVVCRRHVDLLPAVTVASARHCRLTATGAGVRRGSEVHTVSRGRSKVPGWPPSAPAPSWPSACVCSSSSVRDKRVIYEANLKRINWKPFWTFYIAQYLTQTTTENTKKNRWMWNCANGSSDLKKPQTLEGDMSFCDVYGLLFSQCSQPYY